MKDFHLPGHLAAVLAWCLLGTPQLVAGSFLSELNAAQKCQVKGGEQVVVIENVEGKAWPRVKIYRYIDASPEQVAAVFFDFENAKSFVPNVFKSEISNRISSCTVDVDYGLDVPIFPDEFYTARNSLRQVDENSYCFDWKLLRAVLTKDSVGNFRIEPWEEGKSLVCYQNLVTPGSNVAVLLRGRAIEQMKETTKALVAQIEKEKSNPPGLKKQIAALRSALKEQASTQLTKY